MIESFQETIRFLKSNGVQYCDIRFVDRLREEINTENKQVVHMNSARSRGVGIRVIYEGSIGFACTQNLEALMDTANKALEIAKASRTVQKEKICLAPKEAVVDSYYSACKIDPFTVPNAEKLSLLFSCENEMRKLSNITRTKGSMRFQKEDKLYVDSDGSIINQTLYRSGAGIQAFATSQASAGSQGQVQVRSYPDSYGGTHASAGYEYLLELDLLGNAYRIAEEAVSLAAAEQCPSGELDLIIDGSQLAIQVHESIGHPTELDRIFGAEAASAGGSFLEPDSLMQQLQYGSRFVNVVADGTQAQGLGTYGYDDDGVKSTSTTIIENGILKNFITSRETAVKLGQISNGCSFADGWSNLPIVRMTNINLLPGDFGLDELISGVEKGLYLCTNKSWSIDDKRMNFQFSCEIAYEIINGKLSGRIFKDPVYTGTTPKFWASCDGVCKEKHWRAYGIPNCIKGQPSQVSYVGHGAAPARFRNVKVGYDVK